MKVPNSKAAGMAGIVRQDRAAAITIANTIQLIS